MDKQRPRESAGTWTCLEVFVLCKKVIPVFETRVYIRQLHAYATAEIGIRVLCGLLVAALMTGQKFVDRARRFRFSASARAALKRRISRTKATCASLRVIRAEQTLFTVYPFSNQTMHLRRGPGIK